MLAHTWLTYCTQTLFCVGGTPQVSTGPLQNQGTDVACCEVRILRWCACVYVAAGLEFSGNNESATVSELKEMLAMSMRVREKSEVDKMVREQISLLLLGKRDGWAARQCSLVMLEIHLLSHLTLFPAVDREDRET